MPKASNTNEVGGGAPTASGGRAGAPAGGGSVRVVPARSNAMEEAQRISANHAQTNRAAERKSGELAKTTASRVNTNPAAGRTGNERIVVKVDSNPKTSQGTQAGHAITNDSNHTRTVK